ncbi:hypothetical protein ACG873_09445 [Mesorhizobium sp. AaZ16]|uniref:hypothetical protein n=1 Tax=Mesorhizobium sp. AaZ16 TaxID=3402289 RepID=UPI00374FD947
MGTARTINMTICAPPLDDAQVIKIAKSVWLYEVSGKIGRADKLGRRRPASRYWPLLATLTPLCC